MISKLKRQAEILSKECGLSHSKALNLASKLNGFKDYHQAQKEKPEVNPFSKPVLNFHIEVDPQGIVLIRGPFDKGIGLTVFSTESRERAEALVAKLCTKTGDGKYYLLPKELFNAELPETQAVKQLPQVGKAFAALHGSMPMTKLMRSAQALTGSNYYKVKAKKTAEVSTFFTVAAKSLEEAVTLGYAKAEEQDEDAWEVAFLEEHTRVTDVQNQLEPGDYLTNEGGLQIS